MIPRPFELAALAADHNEQLAQPVRPSLGSAHTLSSGATTLAGPHRVFGPDPAGQLRWAEKMETLGRLGARVAHEVNNQVMLMLGRTQLVLQRGATEGASRAEVEELHRAAEHVVQLMRQWQTLGRREPTTRQRIDLNSLLQEVVETFRVVLDDRIDLLTDFEAERPCVLADRGQIEHILLNLLFNARDALAGRGTLTVRTANAELRGSSHKWLMPFTPGPHVMFSVRDTGCGMDRATLQRIFEPYFTTKRPGKGSGLGLHTVWETVRENGGTLQVSSTPSEGTFFAVYLPLAPDQAQSIRRPARVRSETATILVVDDEDSVRALLREVLRRQGYTVLEAGDSGEALQQVESHGEAIDLLICDCELPQVPGGELARRLRTRFPDLSVLYVSGYSPSDAAGPGCVDPGDPFLQKPFTAATLTSRVGELLG